MLELLIGYLIVCLVANYILFHFLLLFPRSFPRPYKVLNPSDTIQLNEKHLTAEAISNSFKPIIRQSISLRGPQPYDIWCEVIDTENNPYFDIFYRVHWLNENHPNRFLDIMYQIFRTFYFGSRQDMEYILLRINRSTKKIITIKFETDRNLKPDHSSPEHIVVQLSAINDSQNKYESMVDGVQSQLIELSFVDQHPIIEVLTWNHVFMVGYLSDKYTEYELPLKFMSEKQYKRYRFDRRSWINYGLKINKKMPLQRAFVITIITLFGSIIIGFFLSGVL